LKPMDILDALSDLPEEYAAFEVQKADLQGSSDTAQTAPTHKERIVMNHTARITQTPHRVSIAGIAAAIALCVGLNAALIFGIARLKQDPNTQMPGSEPPVQEITTSAETESAVTAPDLIGKDWETVKEKYKGLYLAKHYVEANDQPAETVIAQDPKPGDNLPESGIVRCDVTMTSESYPLTMEFPVPPDLPYSDDTLLIVIKDVGGYIWGCSDEFSAKSGDIVNILADVPELDTPVTAWLMNVNTWVSYPIGEYTLHGPTCKAPGGETHSPYYSTFSESRDIAFRQVLQPQYYYSLPN